MTRPLQQIRGIIPALLTAFQHNEEFDPIGSKNLIDFLIEADVDGFYLTGSTGEGIMMESTERMKAVSSMIRDIYGRKPVIVHIGTLSGREAARLAAQAQDAGADAISSIPPYYYGFSKKEIIDYYQTIAKACSLPVVIYNIPSATGVAFDVNLVKEMAQIPTVQGIKYTMTNHYEMGRIKRHMGPDFMVYSGCDEMMLSGLLSGADGAIGSTYNVFPDMYKASANALYQGDAKKASAYLLYANDILEILFRYRLMPAMRAALRFMGVDTGIDRSPFALLDASTEAQLHRDLATYFTEHPDAAFCMLGKAVLR